MAAPVTVGELQQAWLAVQRGEFRPLPPPQAWQPAGQGGLLVVGAHPQAGTSTIALALAQAHPHGRLVDCAPTTTSGLVGVTDRELGQHPDGWWQAQRGHLLVDRSPLHAAAAPDACPLPPQRPECWTVVDPGFDAATVAASRCWLTDLFTNPAVPVVLVARATVPGLRRLTSSLPLLGDRDRIIHLVIVGLRKGPRARGVPLPDAHPITYVPLVGSLAVQGLTPHPLPAPVTNALHPLIPIVEGAPR